MKHPLSCILLVLCFYGCSPQKIPLETETSLTERLALWRKHQTTMSTLDNWEINGRLVAKNEVENIAISLYWKQDLSNYELRFIAPLWQGTYILNGTQDGVVMKGPKNQILAAHNAEELLKQNFGWQAPIEALKYWIRGLPDPSTSYQRLLLDKKGRLLNVDQSEFNISITGYTEQSGFSLPKQVVIKYNKLLLKFFIQHWQI